MKSLPAPQFGADGGPHRVGPVGDVAETVRVHLATAQRGDRSAIARGRGEVAVAPGLGDRPTGAHDPRTVAQAALDRPDESGGVSPGVANGREPPQQGRLGQTRHPQGDLDGAEPLQAVEVHRRDHVVHVGIDEAGENVPTAGVDLPVDRATRPGLGHLGDAIAVEHEVPLADDRHRVRIEQVPVHDRGDHGRSLAQWAADGRRRRAGPAATLQR